MRVISASQSSREWAHHLDDTIDRWRMRRGIDGWTGNDIRTMGVKSFRSLVRDSDRETLIGFKELLDEINADVVAQLKDPGRYIPDYDDWQYGAITVQGICGKRSQVIQNQLSVIKKGRKLDFVSWFMRVAEDTLAPDVFEEMKDEAGRRMRADE